MPTKPLGFINNQPYFTYGQKNKMLHAGWNSYLGRGNPGVWGTAGANPYPRPPEKKIAANVPGGGAGGGGAGGSMPDNLPGPFPNPTGSYPSRNPWDILTSSPWYQQALAGVNASNAAAGASRKSSIQSMLAQFGLIPAGFSDKYGDIDATTRSLADQNTKSGISGYARLVQGYQDAQRESSRRLAAKGLRRSGTRGYQMRRNQLSYDRNYADAINSLLGQAQGVYSGYANTLSQNQMNLANALASAVNNLSFTGFNNPETDAVYQNYLAQVQAAANSGNMGSLLAQEQLMNPTPPGTEWV